MKERRLGKFVVEDRLLREAADSGHGANMFSDMVPLDIQRDWISGRTTYLAWHPDFEEVPDGYITPEYEAIFESGEVKPRWVLKGST